jgi:hypothetical protein
MSQRCLPSCRPGGKGFVRRFRSLRGMVPLLGAITLAACGSGDDGAGGGATTPQPGVLQLSVAAQSVGEASGAVTITITRTGGSDGAVSATLATSDGTAVAGQDFTSTTTSVAFAAGDSIAKTVNIAISDDALADPAETFIVTLSAATGGAQIGAPASTTVTIQDNDTIGPTPGAGSSLNDTGLTACANGASNGVACNNAAAGTDQYPDQDAEHGRDVAANDDSDGHAGFSFTKLDAGGAPLPDQSLSYGAAPWDCVRDNVTGLLWEVKPDDGGLRDRDWTYSWYNSSGIDDGGDEGVEGSGKCLNASTCDTEKYVAIANSALVCGRDDWRLPTRTELLSLIDYGATAAPLIVTSHFPDVSDPTYWSSSNAGDEAGRVGVSSGEAGLSSKRNAHAVRVVSGGGSQ